MIYAVKGIDVYAITEHTENGVILKHIHLGYTSECTVKYLNQYYTLKQGERDLKSYIDYMTYMLKETKDAIGLSEKTESSENIESSEKNEKRLPVVRVTKGQ